MPVGMVALGELWTERGDMMAAPPAGVVASTVFVGGRKCGDLVFGEEALPVCGAEDAERAGVGGAGVEVDADDDDGLEYVEWGLAVGLAVLGVPRAEAGRVDAFGDGDGGVLVPGDEPVGVGGFVEEDGADDSGLWACEGCDGVFDCGVGGEGGELGFALEDSACAGAAAGWGAEERVGDCGELCGSLRRDEFVQDEDAVAAKSVGLRGGDHGGGYACGMEIDVAKIGRAERYKLLIGGIVPRPIAFVSTVGVDGSVNLAPFSFFTAIGSDPMMVMFCPANKEDGTEKDTLRNAKPVSEGGTGEFVVNIVSVAIAEQMAACAANLPHGESEFALSGLTPVPSARVKPARVKECRLCFECVTTQVIRTNPGAPGGRERGHGAGGARAL